MPCIKASICLLRDWGNGFFVFFVIYCVVRDFVVCMDMQIICKLWLCLQVVLILVGLVLSRTKIKDFVENRCALGLVLSFSYGYHGLH